MYLTLSKINQVQHILENIRNIRNYKGYSQSFIASKLNISINSYNQKERGKVEMPMVEFFEIAEILNVDPLDLLNP